MNREIRFRYWDGTEVNLINSLYFFKEEGIHEVNQDGSANGYFNEFVLMQFTNQTDINNKDIYDQDIVKLTFENAAWDEPVVYHEVVRFHNGMWMAGDKPLYRDEYAPYTVEVVGNVFENEELVKG